MNTEFKLDSLKVKDCSLKTEPRQARHLKGYPQHRAKRSEVKHKGRGEHNPEGREATRYNEPEDLSRSITGG